MIVFPNCKINLGLNIIQRREDGYHDLETIFYPLPVCDILEIIPAKNDGGAGLIPLSVSGLEIDGDINQNLCLKALRLLRERYPQITPVQMHLHKVVPAGSGLGGGSSDAAFTLSLLNEIFRLGISSKQLQEDAASLGSDCPFFLINKPCFSTGRGELLEEIELDLGSYKIFLVNPGIAIPTKEAFAGIVPARPEVSVKEIIRKPVKAWKDELRNDFEETIFRRYPEIAKLKNDMYYAGAGYASMSGSGSSVYGIFPKEISPEFNFPPHYFTRQVNG